MATRSNKLFLIAILGAFGLTACSDDVASYPKDGAILPPSQSQDIYHNELSSIYEKIRDGSLASDVLDKLLYEYANTIFGRYSVNAPSYSTNDSDEKTLSQVANGSAADKEAYVKEHKAFWPGATIPENPTASQIATAVAKLEAIYQSVEDRIAEALYSKISNGAYSEHNIFSEEKFLASLYFDGKHVQDYRAAAATYEGLIPGELEGKDVFAEGVLQKEYYYSDDNTYALEENIENIYRELLIEQYITDKSYTTLGRSYARKVNVLSLKVDSANKGDVPALVNYLVENVIASKNGANKLTVAADDRHGEEAVKDLYETVGRIMKGLPSYFDTNDSNYDELAKTIVDDLYTNYGLYGDTATLVANPDENFLTSTEYGSMMKDYRKIQDNLVLTDSSVESSFTGSGAYTIALGKEYKEREIALKTYTTNGWHLKNGGLSSLPDTIRNRLFNLSVASALDAEDGLVDRTDDDWSYEEENSINRYVAKVNGAYFLKAETVEDSSSNKDLYFYDSGSSTYYFVQIIEAVNPSKLSVDGSGRYASIYKDGENYNDILQETIAREVCEQVAKISSYSGLAKDHWLEQMSLEYHDTTIYDYFKSNYPDLFD